MYRDSARVDMRNTMDTVSVVTLQRYPKSFTCGCVKSTFWHRGVQCSALCSECIFCMYLHK